MPAYLLDSDTIKKNLKISAEEADHRLKSISPLVRGEDGLLYTIVIPELFKTAFTMGPELSEKVDANSLSLISCFHTYHTCGYHMFFKPTIAEVLAQIPFGVLNGVPEPMYFETLFDDALVEIIDNGFYGHRTTTLIYKKI